MFSIFKKNSIKSILISELDEKLNEINLIDIRESYETSAGFIKGSKKVPMNTLLNNPEKYLNKEDKYYIICQSGMRSLRTCKILNKLGYNVFNIKGGFRSYTGKNIKR